MADGYCRRLRSDGTLIHNGLFMSLTPGTLPVSLIESGFGCPAISEIGCFQLTAAGGVAAMETAVALSSITAAADAEDPTAFAKAANPQRQNIFDGKAHILPEGRTGQSSRFVSAFYRL